MSKYDNKESLWFQVEKEIATLLLDKFEAETITPERAIAIAKFVIRTIPHKLSDQQMLEIIPKLDDEFYELAAVVAKHIQEYENKFKDKTINSVEELVKQGKLQEAQDLMEKYFQKKL